MKNAFIPLLALALSTSAQATDVGLGFTLGGYGTGISVPVKLNNGMTIEGFVAQEDEKFEYPDNSTERMKWYNFGAGVYWRKTLSNSMEMYLGPKIYYTHQKNTNSYGYSNVNGYTIAPTLGLEYSIAKNVSVGGEVGVSYSRQKYASHHYDTNITETSTKYKAFGTYSGAFIRLYF